MVNVKKNLTGRKFGRLTVVCQTDDYIKPNGRKASKWHCICDCEKTKDVIGYNLISGNSTQCDECANISRTNNLKKQNKYIARQK